MQGYCALVYHIAAQYASTIALLFPQDIYLSPKRFLLLIKLFLIMDPVNLHDETIAAIKDYFNFLVKMYMDPTDIEEPPEGGWPNITKETMRDLKKDDDVIALLRHLPRISLAKRPEVLPGCLLMDWKVSADDLINGEIEGETLRAMSQGWDYQFRGKIPKHCLGLTLIDRDEDVIIINTGDGMVYWQVCPPQVKEFASPQPGDSDYPLEEDVDEPEDHNEVTSPTYDDEQQSDEEQEGNNENSDEESGDESESSSDDGDLLRWGPGWPIRHFFEMLKNHFRELNFIPKTSSIVVDTWQTKDWHGDPLPEGILTLMKSIYRKHGWPDLTKYDKTACLAEIKRELDEKYPQHRVIFLRWR